MFTRLISVARALFCHLRAECGPEQMFALLNGLIDSRATRKTEKNREMMAENLGRRKTFTKPRAASECHGWIAAGRLIS